MESVAAKGGGISEDWGRISDIDALLRLGGSGPIGLSGLDHDRESGTAEINDREFLRFLTMERADLEVDDPGLLTVSCGYHWLLCELITMMKEER